MENALQKDDKEEAITIAGEIKDSLQKVTHHGKRADMIVKGMLQHSRAISAKKELTDKSLRMNICTEAMMD
jgi:two-component system, NtrC family, sensor kinase